MTPDEFDRWLESHATAFGDGCVGYLSHAPAAQAWFEILGGYDVQDATAGTTKLLAGDLGEWRAFNDHPRLLRAFCYQRRQERMRIARAPAPTFHDAYRCLTCKDTGWVTVWCGQAIATALAGQVVYLGTSVMPCSCNLGEMQVRGNGRAFDAAVDPRPVIGTSLLDQMPDLIAFLKTAKKPRRPGHAEFAEYAT